jgi:4-hydroxybenzoyl-CoA thioesterase
MAFCKTIKVCFSDIDYAGIMYYPRFLHYFHVALEEFFGAELGIGYPEVLIRYRIGFPTVHLETNFSKPINYGDEIEVEVTVKAIGRTSVTWGYRVCQSKVPEKMIVEGHNVTVTVNIDTYEKIQIPDWLRQRLEDYKLRTETAAIRKY